MVRLWTFEQFNRLNFPQKSSKIKFSSETVPAK